MLVLVEMDVVFDEGSKVDAVADGAAETEHLVTVDSEHLVLVLFELHDGLGHRRVRSYQNEVFPLNRELRIHSIFILLLYRLPRLFLFFIIYI